MYSAIIDNTALVDLTRLHDQRSFLDVLKNIFHTLYIPMEVKNEYAVGLAVDPNRAWLLDRLNPEQGFFRLCTSYDSFAKIAVEKFKEIDKGEAEIYAQFKKVSIQIVISDDKRFKNALRLLDTGIKVYTTLHLLCWLDIWRWGGNWEEIIRKIHPFRPFSSADLRIAYREMLQKFGIDMTKKDVNKKCALRTILGA